MDLNITMTTLASGIVKGVNQSLSAMNSFKVALRLNVMIVIDGLLEKSVLAGILNEGINPKSVPMFGSRVPPRHNGGFPHPRRNFLESSRKLRRNKEISQ